MIVTCNACHKRYLIEKEDIGSDGRRVRCVACGYSWRQHPIEDPVAVIPPKPTTFDPGYTADIRSTKKMLWPLWIGGLLTISIAFYMVRGVIVTEWPTTGKFFDLLHIPVHHPYKGLVLDHVSSFQTEQSGYALKGEIHNEGSEALPLPVFDIIAQGDCKYAGLLPRMHTLLNQVKARLLGYGDRRGDLCILKTWTYRLTEKRIFPGERISFETPSYPAIPGATDIAIEF